MIYTCFALFTATWWWGCCFWNKALTMNRQDHSWWQYSQPWWRGCSIFLGTRYKPQTLLTDNVTAGDSTHIHGHGDVLFLDVVVVLVYIQHDDGIGQCECCICVVEWLSIAFLKIKKKKTTKMLSQVLINYDIPLIGRSLAGVDHPQSHSQHNLTYQSCIYAKTEHPRSSERMDTLLKQ